jgi:hypothetical protein
MDMELKEVGKKPFPLLFITDRPTVWNGTYDQSYLVVEQ